MPSWRTGSGSVSSSAGSMTVRAGQWNAPTRFLPCGKSMPELLPDSVEGDECLRLFPGGQLVRLGEPRPERELRVHAVDAGDVRIRDQRDRAVAGDELAELLQRAALDVDAGGGQRAVVQIACAHVGALRVERAPFLVQAAERRLVLREWPVASAHALPARVDVDVEPHGERVVEGVAHRRPRDCASAEREHDRLLLVRAERGFAVVAEDVGDRLAGGRLDQVVRVDATDGACGSRLAGAHEADDCDLLQLIRSAYACHAAMKSPRESPPNFSRAARASSHATAASATTASASTADTSLRSTSAFAASPVCRSTEASGFISVGSGFIPARTTISSPFDIPPSMPPARFDVRRRPGWISSCACDPRSSASAKPSPISTPFTAWMPISAAASRASSLSSFVA